jgi:hypothetical protein
MTAPIPHTTDTTVWHSDSGTVYFRATCTCGWKSSPYVQKITARAHEQRHNEVVAAGEWLSGGAA